MDEQTAEQIAEQKGTPTEPGVASPYRDRPIEENLRLFEAMQAGQIEEGKMVLRAKIDMAPTARFCLATDKEGTVSSLPTRTTVRAADGTSIRCTTSRTDSPTILRV